jgi:hypothetical protein
MAPPVSASSTPDYFIWRPLGKRVAVHFRKSVLDQIEEQVRSAFRPFPTPSGEAGGLLLGSKAVLPDGPAIIVETAEPIGCDHSQGPQFTLSEGDRRALTGQMRRLKAEGVVVVGLYRSHVREGVPHGLSITTDDRQILEWLLPGVASVVLLVRPLVDAQSLADVFFWHEGRVAREGVALPFPFTDAAQLALSEPAPRRERRLRVHVDSGIWDFQSSKQKQRRFSVNKWVLMGVFGALGAAAGYGLVSQFWTPAAPAAEPLQLTAHRAPDAWVFRWSPQIVERDRATRGRVTIREGDRTTTYSLDSAQLRSGQFVYPPLSATVDFNFEAVGDRGPIASESVMVIDPNLVLTCISKRK